MASSSDKNDFTKEFTYWFRRWLTQGGSKKISILLTGKTGAGKSRLVNSLIGKAVADEGRKKEPCTTKVQSYEANIQGIDVVVWDSPGLQDGTANESEYLQDMSTKIKEVDLVIYCFKMDDTRLRDEDLIAMRTLTEVFGKKLWENAVFALTFANKIDDPDAEDDSPAAANKYFTEELKEWDIAFCKNLPLKAKIDPSVVEMIPKVPTGGIRNKLQLPDRENWLTEFWIQCYERMKVGCRVNLLNVNRRRIRFADRPSPFFEERTWKEPDPSSSYKCYPDLMFNPVQTTRVEKSTWEAFKDWVGDKWEGVKKALSGFLKLFTG